MDLFPSSPSTYHIVVERSTTMQQVPPHSPFGDLPQSPAPTYPPLSSPDFLLSPRSPPATPKSFATSWITGPRSSKTSSKSSSALFFGGHTLPVVEEQQGGQLRRQLKSRHGELARWTSWANERAPPESGRQEVELTIRYPSSFLDSKQLG